MSAKLCVLLGFLALPMLPALRHEFSWRQVLAYVLMAVQPPRLRATLRMLQPGGVRSGLPALLRRPDKQLERDACELCCWPYPMSRVGGVVVPHTRDEFQWTGPPLWLAWPERRRRRRMRPTYAFTIKSHRRRRRRRRRRAHIILSNTQLGRAGQGSWGRAPDTTAFPSGLCDMRKRAKRSRTRVIF